jgi:outer membrane protein OmpA-like peptidoglycan-associated protein/opacity protein-like surface antigen
MSLNIRIIATAAFAVLLTSTLLLHAEEAAQSSASAGQAVPMSPGSTTETAVPYSGRLNIGVPRYELFLGYSYLRAVPTLADGNRLVWMNGGSTSLAFNLNRYLGIVGDFGAYTNSEIRFQGAYGDTIDVDNANVGALSYLFGPRLSFRNHSRFTPFAQALFGGVHANKVSLSKCTFSCTLLPDENAFAMTAGGGLDIKVQRHLAIRLIQAEYLMTRFQDYSSGTTSSQNDMRLSSGIVFRFGGEPYVAPLPPVTYFCSVNPKTVYPGEPIAVSGTALNLDPAKTAAYTWQVDGGTVTGISSTAKIDTTNLASGAYTLKCHVSEGDKPDENADATAPYVVKAFEPPTVSCSASPSIINTGDKSVITAAGVSPQNRPLTYSYSAASGTISGAGASATFDSTGAPAAAVGITCNVTDDKGQTATASTNVTVTVPAEVRQLETRLALHSIFFQTDEPRIENPNGGLVVSQEGTLATLAKDFKRYLELKPDAHLTLTGHADVRGSVEYNQALSERRVVRTKLFLVEQGVPEAKIETLGLGKEDDLTAAQVEEAVKQDPELSATGREKLIHELPVIVLAKNRRVDVTLSTTGQQSVRRYLARIMREGLKSESHFVLQTCCLRQCLWHQERLSLA